LLTLQEEEAKRRMDLERIMEENQKKIEEQQKKMVSRFILLYKKSDFSFYLKFNFP
jgi:hypothetical protein